MLARLSSLLNYVTIVHNVAVATKTVLANAVLWLVEMVSVQATGKDRRLTAKEETERRGSCLKATPYVDLSVIIFRKQ